MRESKYHFVFCPKYRRPLLADANIKAELGAIFTRLCEQVAGDLQRKGYVGQTIGVKLRFADFKIVTRDITLPQPTADAALLRRTAGQCLKRVDLSQRLRLLGVRVGKLQRLDAMEKVAETVAGKRLTAAHQVAEPDLFDS